MRISEAATGAYQTEDPPTIAAFETSLRSDFVMEAPWMRTNGVGDGIPLLGELQAGCRGAFGRLARVLRSPMHVYVGLLVGSAIGCATALVLANHHIGDVWAVSALCVVAAVAERSRVRLDSKGLEVSISLLPSLFAAVLFGPLAAMAVGAASFAGHFHPPYLKWVAYTSSRSLTWCFSGALASLTAGMGGTRFERVAIGTIVGAVASTSLDTTFTAFTYRLRGLGQFKNVFAAIGPLALASVPLSTPVVVLLVVAYQDLSPWTLGLFFGPALGTQRLFLLYQEQRQLAADLSVVNARLERANLSFATALVVTLDARDEYTAGHSAAVAIYARDIAAHMELNTQDQELAHLCGLVHDIGKIGLAPGLLEKPGALTLDERRQMQRHPVIGERILANVEDYAEIAAIVRYHHERWDGEGYPDRIATTEIPLLSRIIAVADAYNAMTSNRPYRDAMPSRVARVRLAQAVETQFDTAVVAAFESVLSRADDEYRTGKRADFSLRVQDPWTDEGHQNVTAQAA